MTARWEASSLSVWGLIRWPLSWLQPSMVSTYPMCWDSPSVLGGAVCHVYTREHRDLLPRHFLHGIIQQDCGVGAECEFCVQDESQQTQPAADGGTPGVP